MIVLSGAAFLLACLAIAAAAVLMIRFAGLALGRARRGQPALGPAALAAACALAIPASAAAGFWAIGAVLVWMARAAG